MFVKMLFKVCLMLVSTVGSTSSQSTQEVRAHSGYTKNGQCSYTFVLPPSSVQQCGSDEGELQQIREQVSQLQDNYQDLNNKKEALEQRVSVLEDSIVNTTQNDYSPSSCTEVVRSSGFDNQRFYAIDPDGPGRGVLPMVVQCDLDGHTAITLIGHNSEARTQVIGFHGPGSYSKDVTYWNSMEQVRAVVDRSSLCKQLIKYECHGSLMWENGTAFAWWMTWDGRQADYWGGASPGSGKCGCGESGACRGRCSCDTNHHSWSEDAGFVTYRDDLPATQLRFGDTGDSGEEGYHTLGKLICYP